MRETQRRKSFVVTSANLAILMLFLKTGGAVWTSWTSSSCTHPCGVGLQYKVRQCEIDSGNPGCVGSAMEVHVCYEQDCPLYNGNDCYDAQNPNGYRGTINISRNGRNCFEWNHPYSGYLPQDYPNSGLEKNYCRNPNRVEKGPWCYTNRKRTRANFCSVPQCPTAEEVFWDAWSGWSTCSVSCGSGGVKHRVRFCNGGGVTQGGCVGDVHQTESCFYIPCNENTSFPTPHRDCAVFWETSSYYGTVSHTVEGVECQRWDSQTPHMHTYYPSQNPSLIENYCRNPDGDKWTWCFTSGDKQWDYCDVPECPSNATLDSLEVGCFIYGEAQNYRGSASTTESGYDCQFWDSNHPKHHNFKSYWYPDTGLGHHNYCRAPDNDSIPWCISTRPGYLWEHCNITECSAQDNTSLTSTVLLNSSLSSCGNPVFEIRGDESSNHDGQRIVGGMPVNKGSIPWQVGLLELGSQSPICGASIIDKEWIMSAAHCFTSGYGPSDYSGMVGRHWRYGGGKEELEVKFQKIILHESYDNVRLINDIALLKLSNPLEFNAYIKPVCLPSPLSSYKAGEYVLVTGWGRTTPNQPIYDEELQQVYVPLVSQQICETSYPRQIYPGMICAGFVQSGEKDACMGDSGGPLVSLAKYEQIGIVSWGTSCAEPGYPGVYTFSYHGQETGSDPFHLQVAATLFTTPRWSLYINPGQLHINTIFQVFWYDPTENRNRSASSTGGHLSHCNFVFHEKIRG